VSKKKVLLRGVFINRDTNGEGVLKVGTTLIRVSTVMGILYFNIMIRNIEKNNLIGVVD
jgi:hypothetical protein